MIVKCFSGCQQEALKTTRNGHNSHGLKCAFCKKTYTLEFEWGYSEEDNAWTKIESVIVRGDF